MKSLSELKEYIFFELGFINPSKYDEDLLNAILKILKEKSEFLYGEPSFKLLSNRERECLCLLAKGKTREEIAQIMNVKLTTIVSFYGRLKKKLSVKTLAEAVYIGFGIDKINNENIKKE